MSLTCPVTMMPATSDSGKVRFHTLNARNGHRIVSRFVHEVSGKTVEDDDQAKGYPKSEDEHVLIEDDELDVVALESTRTVDIEMFVPSASIAWIWYDKPHYLSPSDKIGEEAFSVIRDAMAATGKVGIARLVLYRRERAVMLEPHGKGIVLWTLRYGDEVRDAGDYFNETGKTKPDAALMKLVGNLIDQQMVDWDDSLVQRHRAGQLGNLQHPFPVRPWCQRTAPLPHAVDKHLQECEVPEPGRECRQRKIKPSAPDGQRVD